jgi:putative ABC transport system permease protein
MLLIENIRTALNALRANLMRSFLTTIGIVIGTAAVIAVVSIVQGLEHMITNQLQGVGATYIMVFPTPPTKGRNAGHPPRALSGGDAAAIDKEVSSIDLITPVISGAQPLKFRDRQHRSATLGVTDAWPDVNNDNVDRGRFFSSIDLKHRRKVAVVGQKVVDELELGGDPIGKEIYVGHLPMTVIGIMEERGQSLGQNQDDRVFIPYNTAVVLFGDAAGSGGQLHVQAISADEVERTRDGIEQVLRRRHDLGPDDENDFQVLIQDEMLQTVDEILGGVTAVVGAVVSIALIVGGIGIMNILLVSVTERTREIGLRKALGARRQDILLQFLMEAVTLSLLGGALGVALGYGVGVMVAAMLPEGWPAAYVPLWAILLAFGFCGLVGIFFGIYPAAKASRLDPIDALRYE